MLFTNPNGPKFSDGDRKGTVVDVMDPKKQGRVRVRVKGIHDNVPNDKLPWARPKVMAIGGDRAVNVPIPEAEVYVNMDDPHEPSYSGTVIRENVLPPELLVNYPKRTGYITQSGTIHFTDEETKETKTVWSNGAEQSIGATGSITAKSPQTITQEVNGGAKMVMSSSGTVVEKDATFQNNTTTQGNNTVAGNASVGGNMGISGSAAIGGNANISGAMAAASGTIAGKPINTDPPLSKTRIKDILGYMPISLPRVPGLPLLEGELTLEELQAYLKGATGGLTAQLPPAVQDQLDQIQDSINQDNETLGKITIQLSAPQFLFSDGAADPVGQEIIVTAALFNVHEDTLVWETSPPVTLIDMTRDIVTYPGADGAGEDDDLEDDDGVPDDDDPSEDPPTPVIVTEPDPTRKKLAVASMTDLINEIVITVTGISKLGPEIIGSGSITRGDNLSPTLREQIEAVAGELVDVIDEYGSLGALVDAAQLAADNAVLAKTLAEAALSDAQEEAQNAYDAAALAGGYATTASLSKDEAAGFASAAAASALVASTAASAVGLTSNPQFTNGTTGWVDSHDANAAYTTPTTMSPVTNYQGDDAVLQNATGAQLFARGKVATYVPGRKYRFRARYYTTGVAGPVVFGIAGFDAAGAWVSSHVVQADNPAALNSWVTVNVLLDSTVYDGYGHAQFAPYINSNHLNVAGHTASFGYCYLEDVTESEAAAASALAANISAGAANVSATDAGNFASAAQTASLSAESRAKARGLTLNASFEMGVLDWVNSAGGPANTTTPATWTPVTNYQGDAYAIQNVGANRVLRGSVATYTVGRKYRLRGRFYPTGATAPIAIGIIPFNADGTAGSYVGLYAGSPTLDTWMEINVLLNAASFDTYAMIAPYANSNSGATAGHTMTVGSFYIEDVTESEASAASAQASLTHSGTAATHATNAGNSAAAAATSVLQASAKSTTRGLTSNADFIVGVTDWVDTYVTSIGSGAPSTFTPTTNFQGAANVALNSTNARKDIRGSGATVQASRKYKLRARYWTATTNAMFFGVNTHNGAGVYIASNHQYANSVTPAATWVEVDILIPDAQYASAAYLTPYSITNYTSSGAPTSAQVAIDYLFIEDVTESWTAESQAVIATNEAVTATGAAATATTQANLSATYVSGMATSLSDVFPKTFNPDLFSWNASAGTAASNPPITEVVPSAVAPDRTYVELAAPTYTQFAFRGTMPVTDGDVFRLTADVEQVVSGTGLTNSQWYVRVLDASYNLLTSLTVIGTGMNRATGVRSVQSGTVGYNAPGLCDYNVTTGGAKYFRITLLINRTESSTGTNTGSVARIYAQYIENARAVAESTAQAVIATNQATLADGHRAAAAVQSNLSATYAGNAKKEVIKQLPYTFEHDATYFFAGYDGAPDTRPAFPIGSDGWSIQTITGVGKVIQTVSGSGTRDVSPIGALPVLPGRIYRIQGRCRTLAGSRSVSIYSIGLDDNYAYAGGRTGANAHIATTTWQTFTYDVDPSTLGWFANGLVYIRPMWRANAGSEVIQLSSIKITDITEAMDAASSASIATSQSVIATNAAAAAQASQVLTSSLSQGAINRNVGFDDYPSATVGQLPADWANWSGSSLMYRVADPLGGWALRMPAAAGANAGVLYTQTTNNEINQNNYYVVEADVILNSGTLVGAGIGFHVSNNAGTTIESFNISFSGDASASPTGAPIGNGVVGSTYRFRKLVKVTNASAFGYRLYGMGHWTSVGSVAAANDITWLKLLVRAANQTEIRDQTVLAPLEATVSTHTSTLATHDLRLASYVTKVSAGAGTAELALVATDSGGSPASTITLKADKIKLGSITQPALQISGGVATFYGQLNIDAGSGDRMTILPNIIKCWEGGSLKMKIGNLAL